MTPTPMFRTLTEYTGLDVRLRHVPPVSGAARWGFAFRRLPVGTYKGT